MSDSQMMNLVNHAREMRHMLTVLESHFRREADLHLSTERTDFAVATKGIADEIAELLAKVGAA